MAVRAISVQVSMNISAFKERTAHNSCESNTAFCLIIETQRFALDFLAQRVNDYKQIPTLGR